MRSRFLTCRGSQNRQIQIIQARWAKVFDKIGPKAIALLQGAPFEGGFAFPRQTNDFYYLSGVETPHSYLLLDGRTRKATLFLPPRNARLERSEGRVLSADDAELAKKLTGAASVQPTSAMQGDWLETPTVIYTPFAKKRSSLKKQRRRAIGKKQNSDVKPLSHTRLRLPRQEQNWERRG